MKIVFISSRNIEEVGGIESYMSNLCSELLKRNHEVILYCEGNSYSKFYKNGISIITFKSVKNKFVNKLLTSLIATLHSLMFNKDVDIYHFNAVASALFSWIPMLFSKNVIYQGHGLEWQRTKWSKEQRFIIKLMEKFVVSFSKNITMVSNEQSNYILSKYKKRAVTIPTAVYMPFNSTKDNSILNKYNLESNKYILFLGRLVPEKNPDLLIYSYTNSKLEDIKLVIAGDDIRSPEYIAKIHELAKNNKNIIFTGSVFGNDKHALMNNCLAYCLPSSLEGLPISLLEAMSYKKLCISSDIESSKEALDSFGIYFKDKNTDELTESLNSLSSNMDFSIITNGAYSRVEKYFTWEIVVEKYILFCRQILSKQKN